MVKLSSLRKQLKNLSVDMCDIDMIIMDTLVIDKSKLFFDYPISDIDEKDIMEKVNRLLNCEPVAYITGHKEFMSLNFSVNPSTLIPRADTETLVEEILKIYKDKSPYIFEIGTGSGCIAISLAYYLKNAKITACDISAEALKIARDNAISNNVDSKINFILHDIFKGFPDFESVPDCIVSNPPYIETDVISGLDNNVKYFEPVSALDGGIDGLIFYRQIANNNPLKKGGILAFEIGYNQGTAVSELMKNEYENIRIIKDINNNDRVVIGIKK